jgi:dipeptidase D
MAVLASDDIPHPAIEALFTIDEETGMTGAQGLEGGLLEGTIMLNLDTEDDNELCIGCAGGIDVSAKGTYAQEPTPSGYIAKRIGIRGLTGGHSGMDIHLGRGNANKLMNRLLQELTRACNVRVAGIDGGGLRNAIPRESFAVIVIEEADISSVNEKIESLTNSLKAEYGTTDPELEIVFEAIELPHSVLSKNDQTAILNSIYSCQNGIYRMSPDIPELVQTSNNLARVLVKDGQYEILCLTRSSVDSEKMDLVNTLRASFELIGADVEANGSYPGWTPKPEAPIIAMMSDLYSEIFSEVPEVSACHAGLECGILGTNYPEMDMISFGPNIRGAHSPDEKVQISSVQKFWGYVLEVLKRIPNK